MTPITLGPSEAAPGRPFTSPDSYPEDIDCLRMLIADVSGVLEESAAGEREITPMELMVWREGDLVHRLIVCDEERLLEHDAPCAVGFFSERHADVDIEPLEQANREVMNEFPRYPGVLSYGSIRLHAGQWANLVLHEEPETAEEWRNSQVHAAAVERLSPIHYKNVRIHNARLTAGISADPHVAIARTKYFDYENGSDWCAVRDLPVPLTA
jgi:hypothetical protein